MINILKMSWVVLFFFSLSLSPLVHAKDINRLDLSIKEVMGIYNDIENKPTLNSCRVHKKKNRYYLPEDCNFFVFTAYILENECVTGSKNKIAIGNNAMNVNFKVNKRTCNYLGGKTDVVNKNTKGVLKPINKIDNRAASAVNSVGGVLTPVNVPNSGAVGGVKRIAGLLKPVDLPSNSVTNTPKNTAEVGIVNAEKATKVKPPSTEKKAKQKKYFLQVYVGDTYPSVTYKCDDLRLYTSVIGERVYILSDKYLYTDAVKIQAQILSCGFKTWIRPVDMDWF